MPQRTFVNTLYLSFNAEILVIFSCDNIRVACNSIGRLVFVKNSQQKKLDTILQTRRYITIDCHDKIDFFHN